jgi:hypothetical protein
VITFTFFSLFALELPSYYQRNFPTGCSLHLLFLFQGLLTRRNPV